MKDGNNITHMVKNLALRFDNVDTPFDPLTDREFIINPSQFSPDSSSQLNIKGRTVDIPSIPVYHLSCLVFVVATPWFECWRNLFISKMDSYEHEFLTRYLGCLFIVSTRNPDPLRAYSNLVNHQAQLSKSHPYRWFSQTNIIRFFVLVNDPEMMAPSE